MSDTTLDAIIDLSHHNATPNFKAAYANGLRLVIHKSTQGLGGIDTCYAERVRPIRDVGLMLGAYHFGTMANGTLQAKHFLETVKPDDKTLLVLDWEPNLGGVTMTLQQARDFVLEVYRQTKRYPVLYSGSLAKEVLGKSIDPVLSKCPLWLAQYGPKAVVPPTWTTWSLWQYTDKGPIEGNPGRTADRSQFNGDENGLRKLCGHSPLPM